MVEKIIIARLKHKIKTSPYIGIVGNDGTYTYKEGNYMVKYRFAAEDGRESPVTIISIKHKVTGMERKRRDAVKSLRHFFFNYGWLALLRPQALLLFIVGGIILYLGVIDPYTAKVNRFRWIAASIIGVKPEQLEYKAGLFHLSGSRDVAGRQAEEYISFTFSPFNLLFSTKTGYVSRWSNGSGYVTNPVSFDDNGNVWFGLSDGSWKRGYLSGSEVKWVTPKTVAGRDVSGNKISLEDGGLRVVDQE